MLWRMTRSLACLVLAAAALGGCAASTRVSFPNATPSTPLSVPAEAYRPEGNGPFPAVVLLHGCEGISENGRRWAQWLRGQGYVALVVDSWTPRGLKETCTFTVADPPNTARLDDAFGALRYLQARGDVDPRRIAAMGWSNGGVFSIAVINGPSLERAQARGVALPDPGYAAAIGVYPGGCDSLKTQRVVRPLLVLIGDADDWTSPAICKEMVDAMRAKGADATIEVLPGAYHYFDFEGLARTTLPDVGNDNKPGGCCGATVAFDAAAFATARRRVTEFLGYHLRAR
jgi:dienelactone hydrolase